jgi:hypothetical protein
MMDPLAAIGMVAMSRPRRCRNSPRLEKMQALAAELRELGAKASPATICITQDRIVYIIQVIHGGQIGSFRMLVWLTAVSVNRAARHGYASSWSFDVQKGVGRAWGELAMEE